jgi:predicted ChrR family anti-sigma factor
MAETAAERFVLNDLFGPKQDFSKLAWQPFHPGVEIVRIYGGPESRAPSGPSAALLRYAPGASVPHHGHTGYEHIVVLQGSQRDERGRYPQGTCLIHGQDTGHTVASDEGCVVLAVWQAPVAFTAA